MFHFERRSATQYSNASAAGLLPWFVVLQAILLWLAVVSCNTAVAQQPQDTNPFGEPEPVAPPAAEAADQAEEEDVAGVRPAEEPDPVVRAVLEMQLESPTQLMRAAISLANLNRPDLAKKYLQQLLEAQPSDQELVPLLQQFGSPQFIRFTRDPTLQPEGAELSAAVMQAADTRHRDRARLAKLVEQLGDANALTRQKAVAELLRAGALAVDPLVQSLADAERQQQVAAGQVLVTLGEQAVSPLLAVLDSRDASLRRSVIIILGRTRSKAAVPALLRPAFGQQVDDEVAQAARQALEDILGGLPSEEEAVQFLTKQLEKQLEAAGQDQVGEQEVVEFWTWDASEQRIETLLRSPADAAIQSAAEIAAALLAIKPDQATYQRIFLATKLEIAKRRVGFDQQLPEGPESALRWTADTTVAELENVLALARRRQLEGAAMVVTRLLGQRGDAQLLASATGKPRELVLGLLSPARRVRFATAAAIMELDPQQAYPGCSYLPNVLSYLATSAGRRDVLIAHPRTEMARTLGGRLSGAGYTADTATTGQQVILQATANSDLLFVIISDRIDRPQQTEVLQLLRRDARTAKLAVGLTYREGNRDRAKRAADRDPLTLAFPFPRTQQDAAHEAARLIALVRPRLVLAKERLAHAAFALDALARLAADADRYGFYHVIEQQPEVEQALATSALAAQAAQVLGLLGSVSAQQQLVEFASDPARPLTDRQVAAEAFQVAVQRRHLMLTRSQVMRQYDRYNDSEQLDAGTQKVLASILDTIETGGREAKPEKTRNGS